MRRNRFTKIIATLGPSSSTLESIESLFLEGADLFRLNFSHGSYETHAQNVSFIRSVSKKYNRPIGIMMDLQGPKLRVGKFKEGSAVLKKGERFILDTHQEPGDSTRVCLPHPEIFEAIHPGHALLVDDGKIRLQVSSKSATSIETIVEVPGTISNNKGVNVPSVILPISALTKKDLEDLDFGLGLNVDWVALSFVQRAQDIVDARALIKGRALIISKIEKPQAIEDLDDIVAHSDAVMVARGDLGVEMMPEEVPSIQKKIIRRCRLDGKPVIVATQMLDSMVQFPSPTRAEASDVATAVYDGVDAVMLSAESAAGAYPVESVQMMNRIIMKTETDSLYRQFLDTARSAPHDTPSDAITAAARHVTQTISATAIVTLTSSGSTTWRAARERPNAPIVAVTPHKSIAQQLTLAWGTHPVRKEEMGSISEVIKQINQTIISEGFGKPNEEVVITAGHHFDKEDHHTVFESGSTRVLRILRLE
jgi:pyruvate kinase